jgi:zinc D-Ala-D-Ala carboxypeptidase
MMMSEHFDQREFERDAPIPAECIPTLEFFCQNILEPIRAFVARPMEITSGFRPPDANAAAHGVPGSEHIYTPDHVAADFTFVVKVGQTPLMSLRICFDWIRNNASLPFEQVILEHGANGVSVIHISYSKAKLAAGVRSALEGATHNASAYTKMDVVAFALPDETAQENV